MANTLVVKLGSGMAMFHYEREQVYPPAGYEGTLADFAVFLADFHASDTAEAYGLHDSDALETWTKAGGDRSTITIDGSHVVSLP